MPSRPVSRKSAQSEDVGGGPTIHKLDYHPGGRLLRPPSADGQRESSGRRSEDRSYAGSFFEDIAEGIADQDRARFAREARRYTSFVWAIVLCLGAGSITSFSVYAPLFQKRLHYTQLEVNGVSITAELALYLPVPLFGMLCDRTGPALPSILSGVLFGLGYLLAAFAYKSGPPPTSGGEGWPYWVMIIAFIAVGSGTACGYIAGVTTCAKNFGRGKYKGLALALPIACFGLSGMWQSQIASHVLYETRLDGRRGDVDVYRFFLFLGIYLLVTGFVGFFLLRIVDEEDLIDEAVEELEQSGLLDESHLYRPITNSSAANGHAGYGTIGEGERRLSAEEIDELHQQAEEQKARQLEEHRKKTWLLNEETRRFLTDRTMWWLAAGFFLVTGPGEAFINNMGTIIGTLYPPATSSLDEADSGMTTAATHVSIVAVTSTLARIITGTLTDLLAPSAVSHQHRRGPQSLANSLASLDPNANPSLQQLASPSSRSQISRIAFLLVFSLIMSFGQILLASGALQSHGDKFWLVSASIGTGYGAVFSLTPIIVSVIWGVENFGTNWGILATSPAIGATIWGLVYSWVYQWAADLPESTPDLGVAISSSDPVQDVLCHGVLCYAPTFWAMAASVWLACGLWLWAWKGSATGWSKRGIAV